MKISVVIPTLNEEKDLPRTLDSLKGFADEIVIIDSNSTDRTLEIASKYHCRVFIHPFVNFEDTRNFGDSKAKGDFILSLEADVVLSEMLKNEIKQVLTSSQAQAFFIPRLNIIWGKPILHTDWGPSDDSHIWLYKKGSGKWVNTVHEEYKTKHKVGRLKNHLIHYNYETINEFIDKIGKYSDLSVRKGIGYPSYWFLRDFIKRYIYKRGFQDGYHGLFLSYLQSVYYLTHKVKQMVIQ